MKENNSSVSIRIKVTPYITNLTIQANHSAIFIVPEKSNGSETLFFPVASSYPKRKFEGLLANRENHAYPYS